MHSNTLLTDSPPLPTVRASRHYRLVAAALALAIVGLGILAARLEPDARGYGTHEQMGLPACGFLSRTGYPCPTCGMTTAFALVARGRLAQAWVVQPAGAAAALLLAAVALGAAWSAATGRRLDRFTDSIAWSYPKWLIGALVVVLASWGWLCWRNGWLS